MCSNTDLSPDFLEFLQESNLRCSCVATFSYFLVFVRACVCIFVCMGVRILQFHVCRPMITSSKQNRILDMCFTRK